MDKPKGGETEYDLLNTLVDFNDQAIIASSVAIQAETGWGLCRARMAAIIERVASRKGWPCDWEYRAVILARFRRGAREN